MTVSSIKRWIEVPFIKGGTHRYVAATTDPNLSDVSYLGNEHFHYFYFYVKIQVYHADRCIEFQQFRKWCESLYVGELSADFKSCEMLAEELIQKIADKFPGRSINVRVYEDNINGCQVDYTPIDRI